MVLKRGLSAVLAASLSMSSLVVPNLAFAADESGESYATSPSSDTINIILAAMRENDPVKAKALLDKAKQAAANEKLPKSSLENINALLSSAQAKLNRPRKQNFSADTKISFNLDNTVAAPSTQPLTPDQQTVLVELLKGNPDLRQSMREVELGRTNRDANPNRLNEIVFAETNKTVDQHDATNYANDLALSDAGEFVAALRGMKLIKDYSAQNRALRTKYDSLTLDDLALQIISSTAKWSAGLGAIKNTIAASGLSWRRNLAGVSVEALGNFVINANLVLRLANLYGVQLDDTQQDVLIVTTFMGAKLGYFAVKNRPVFKEIGQKLGRLFAMAKASKNPKAMSTFVLKLASVPMIARALNGIPGFAQLENAAKATPGLAGTIAGLQPQGPPTRDGVGPVPPPTEVKPAPAAANEEGAAKSKASGEDAKSFKFRYLVAGALWGAAKSGIETGFIGALAMSMLDQAKKTERELDTKQFREFLMSNKGQGFIKLLILTMNTGDQVPDVLDIRKTKDPKANFILNLARSTKICSPADLARFNVLNSQDLANKKLGRKTTVTNTRDYKLLRFACDSRLSSGPYNRIAKEFLTFDAIPQRWTDLLRTASYENRLRMGEIVMQLQFLDGDQDDAESKFFDQTVSKLLGLNRAEDVNYFDRFLAFIRQNGGMRENPASPTGYSVDTNNIVNPFTDVDSYSPIGGPESPAAPAVAVSTMSATPAVTGQTTTTTVTTVPVAGSVQTPATPTAPISTAPSSVPTAIRPVVPSTQPFIPRAISDAEANNPIPERR